MLAVLPTGHGKGSLRWTVPLEFDLQFAIGIYGDELGHI